MTTQHRIQTVSPSVRRECLAERTHIYVDWLAMKRGEIVGEASFDNGWYLQDAASGAYIAREAQPAPGLTITLAEALAWSMLLPEPTSVITGQHVMQAIAALHATRMEALLAALAAPPPEPGPVPTPVEPTP